MLSAPVRQNQRKHGCCVIHRYISAIFDYREKMSVISVIVPLLVGDNYFTAVDKGYFYVDFWAFMFFLARACQLLSGIRKHPARIQGV
jgi:hypothetical protein